ncbi:MAG TPA: hypothetical protein DDW85_03935 [Porphyromonadaceae bacterium]|nr:hypothetical protein [Porphyromonadaceae bacterium]
MMKIEVFRNAKWLIPLFGTLLCVFISCDSNEGAVDAIPSPLNNVKIENIQGGTIFTYDTPKESDVILITAEYPTDDGGKQIQRFDIAKHSFSFTLSKLSPQKRFVELYTVNKYGNRSESVEMEIEPILPYAVTYLREVLNTLTVNAIANGIQIDFSNSEAKKIFFNISYKDNSGTWIDYGQKTSSSEQQGSIEILELPYAEFNIYLSDSEQEKSGTKSFSVTPIINKMYVYGEVILAGKLENAGWRKEWAEIMEKKATGNFELLVYNHKENGEFLFISSRGADAVIYGKEGENGIKKNSEEKFIIPEKGYHKIIFNPTDITYSTVKVDPADPIKENVWIWGEGFVEITTAWNVYGGVKMDKHRENPNLFIKTITRNLSTFPPPAFRLSDGTITFNWKEKLDLDDFASHSFVLGNEGEGYAVIPGNQGEEYVVIIDLQINKGVVVKKNE